MKTREELITGIRDILTALGVTEIYWGDLDLGQTPIFLGGGSPDKIYELEWVKINGVSGDCRWKNAFWGWDELPTEIVQTIYNHLNEYDTQD